MKLLLSIIVATIIMLTGLPPAFGISLLKGKTPSVNRWPYSFGVHYIYDNGGSSWNYDTPLKQKGFRNNRGYRHDKHRHFRFSYPSKRPSAEKLEGLIKHLTRHNSNQKELFPPLP